MPTRFPPCHPSMDRPAGRRAFFFCGIDRLSVEAGSTNRTTELRQPINIRFPIARYLPPSTIRRSNRSQSTVPNFMSKGVT